MARNEHSDKLNRERSRELYEEAKTLFPGGVHSPVRAFKSVSGPPLFIREADGAYMTDEDGNRLLDFCCSWGPLILGHNHPAVRAKVIETVARGTSFGTPTALGNELGRLILEYHSYIDRLRFVNSGTESVMSALRLARGYTGRDLVVKFEGCYHGHVDPLMVEAGSGLATFGTSTSAGIPKQVVQDTIVLPLDKPEQLKKTFEEHGEDIACIVVEPIPANNGLLIQDEEYLRLLRDLCDQHDSLLIFDEVISGFRIGFEGAAGHYDIQPDLITFGKIIGGGMPVGAYAGKEEIMRHVAPEGPVYQAGTLSANPVTMAAGLATLQECLRNNFYNELEEKADRFAKHLDDLPGMHLQRMGSIFWIAFSNERITRADQITEQAEEHFKTLHERLLNEQIYLGPSAYEVGFISDAHSSDDLERAARTIREQLLEMAG